MAEEKVSLMFSYLVSIAERNMAVSCLEKEDRKQIGVILKRPQCL